MSKHVFGIEVSKVNYQVESEVLPSGGAAFTFNPPLPGRAPVIHVDPDIVEDIVRTFSLAVDYDPEDGGFVLALPYVDTEEDIQPNPDEEGYSIAAQLVPDELALEMVLDQVTETCPNCERLHFGEDIWPSIPDKNEGGSTPACPKKPLLN